jgi:hypothetical protein
MNPALIIGGVVVALGALAAFAIPGRPRHNGATVGEQALEAA